MTTVLRRCLLALPCLAAAVAAAACETTPSAGGYEMRSRFPEQYRTIAVTLFRNDTQDRPLNGQLTEALIKEVQASTPYHIASDARADTLLRGTVRRRDLRMLSKSVSTGLSEEMLYEVSVDWEWVDQRTGNVIVARNGFSASSLFVPSRPSAEPTEVGRFAVVQTLAADIVANLQSQW
jgi:hypothetical protein